MKTIKKPRFLTFTELKEEIELPVSDWRTFKKLLQNRSEKVPFIEMNGRFYFQVLQMEEWLRKKAS